MPAFTCVERSPFWAGSRIAGWLSCLGTVVSLSLTWQELGKSRRGHLPMPSVLSLLLLSASFTLESQPIPPGQKTAALCFIPCLLSVCPQTSSSNAAALPLLMCCALSWWSNSKDVPPMRTGWESSGCSAWRKQGSEKTFQQPYSTKRGAIRKIGTDYLAGPVATKQGVMVLN